MAGSTSDGEIRRLARNLVLVAALAVGLYVLFTIFRHRFLSAFNSPEVELLEAGAVVLVAYVAARAVTATTTAVLTRRGQHRHGAAVRLFLNLLVGVAAILALSDLAGVSAESIFLGSAFAGIFLGLAAQTVLSNVFAGLLLVVANPFRPGDRIGLVSSNFGLLAPSYPHEVTVPSYSGIVEDVGLVYTVLGLDTGSTAKVPNSMVLGSLVLQPRPDLSRAHRIRMSFPLSVSPASVEAALPELGPLSTPAAPNVGAPRLEVADLSPTTWDGVITLWTTVTDESLIRDRVMRAVLDRVGPSASSASKDSGRRPTP
jgi:small-conductance mechanosensitive channel